MRSGEAARRGGVSVDTLAHYERLGLLPAPARDVNGYRRYATTAVDRVRLIQRALDMGFTLGELGRVLKQRDAGRAPCGQVRAIAAARLKELEERIDGLHALRDELRSLVAEWDARLASIPVGQRAGLLDALAQTPAQAVEPRRVRRRARGG
jgi:DNA-binding transcriptional MerR regulator